MPVDNAATQQDGAGGGAGGVKPAPVARDAAPEHQREGNKGSAGTKPQPQQQMQTEEPEKESGPCGLPKSCSIL